MQGLQKIWSLHFRGADALSTIRLQACVLNRHGSSVLTYFSFLGFGMPLGTVRQLQGLLLRLIDPI